MNECTAINIILQLPEKNRKTCDIWFMCTRFEILALHMEYFFNFYFAWLLYWFRTQFVSYIQKCIIQYSFVTFSFDEFKWYEIKFIKLYKKFMFWNYFYIFQNLRGRLNLKRKSHPQNRPKNHPSAQHINILISNNKGSLHINHFMLQMVTKIPIDVMKHFFNLQRILHWAWNIYESNKFVLKSK